MFDASEAVDAAKFQSIFQLGVAVALTFVVAGPEVRKILSQQIQSLVGLRDTLSALKDEGVGGNISARLSLVDNLNRVVTAGEYETVKVNAGTTLWYIGLAVTCFGFLLYSSIYEHMLAGMVLVGCLTVGAAIFYDPIRISFDALKLSKLINLVHGLARVVDPEDPEEKRVKDANRAVALLAAGMSTIEDTIRELKEISKRIGG